MDLLEYQGKELFARHGVPIPDGQPATSVEDAVSAADELGYPVVIKAQVLIGGRGKAGGIKLANSRDEAERYAADIFGMDIRGFTVHELYVEKASDIAEEYYAAVIFDRGAKKPMVMLSRMGGMDVEEIAEKDPDRHGPPARRPAGGLPGLPRPPAGLRAGHRRGRRPPGRRDARAPVRGLRRRGRDAGRGQPAAGDRRPRGGGAGRQGHGGRQRALPPPRHRRPAQRRAPRTRRS